MRSELDIAVLDTGGTHALAFARLGPHFAVERLPCDEKVDSLLDFRERIDKALKGDAKRPSATELSDFGTRLFETLFVGGLRDLFREAEKSGYIRLHLVSNHPKLQSLPWEFLREPNRAAGPHRNRSVVRVFLGQCRSLPRPLVRGQPLRVVLAYAEAAGEDPVPYPEVELKMKTTFQARMPKELTLDVVRAATVTALQDAVSDPANPCHIFHFLGHGVVKDGSGYLLLEDQELDARQLSLLLGGCGIRMVILSACDTAAGAFQTDFSVCAQTLVAEGIPVVLANQLPIPTASMAPFVGTFYKHLITTGDVDLAVAEARLTLNLMLASPNGEVGIEWGIPTLYRSIGSERFFTS